MSLGGGRQPGNYLGGLFNVCKERPREEEASPAIFLSAFLIQTLIRIEPGRRKAARKRFGCFFNRYLIRNDHREEASLAMFLVAVYNRR